MTKAQELEVLQQIKDGDYTEPVKIENEALQTIENSILVKGAANRYALEHLREAYKQPKA
jgi:hypothetical protein